MFIGTFEHTMDPKFRINVPAKFREDLGEKFVITRGLDECVAIYSMEAWQRWQDKIKELPESKSRMMKRYFFAGATEVEPDKQGRIVVSSILRKHAGLEKDVVIIGANDRAEIWDAEKWYAIDSEITSDAVAAEMDALDF